MNLLDKIPQDKAKHYIAGSMVACVAAAVCIRINPSVAWQAAIGASLILGVLKEGLDYYQNRTQGTAHGVEFWDAFATAMGGVPVALPLF